MRINTTSFLNILCILILNTSCVHYYYAPSSNNVTLFKEKKEARIEVQYCENSSDGGNSLSGFEIQSAYAVGNHTGVQLNFFHTGEKDKDYGSGSGNYVEAAAGYFKPFNNSKWIFENYAGIGIAGVKNQFDFASKAAKTSVTKFFLQPSLGFRSRDIDFAFSSKFSLVNFGVNKSTDVIENNVIDYDDLKSLKEDKSHFYVEPGIMLRGGFNKVKFSVKYTYSITGKQTFAVAKENLSVGAVFLFNPKSNKK